MNGLVAKLKEHHERMTAGEWSTGIQGAGSYFDHVVYSDHEGVCRCDNNPREEKHNVEDAEGIAFLRNSLPTIIARLERAQRIEEAARALAYLDCHKPTCDGCTLPKDTCEVAALRTALDEGSRDA